MTERQDNEAKAIVRELRPRLTGDGICCLGPEDLAFKFREYLQSNGVEAEVFNRTEIRAWGEVSQVYPKHASESQVRDLLETFARDLALDPGEDVPGYWGGTLPPDVRIDITR